MPVSSSDDGFEQMTRVLARKRGARLVGERVRERLRLRERRAINSGIAGGETFLQPTTYARSQLEQRGARSAFFPRARPFEPLLDPAHPFGHVRFRARTAI